MTSEEKQAFHQLQAQFAEQKTQIESQQKRIADLEEQVKVKWNYIDKNLPSWSVATVDKLYNRNVLQGDGNGLQLNWLMLRILVILDRSGALDLATEKALAEEKKQ